MSPDRKLIFRLPVFLAKAGIGRTKAVFPKRSVIYSQGDPADVVFYIRKGRVKLTVASAQGKEAITAILGTGEFCGEGCLSGHSRRMATASALTDCEAMQLEKSAMWRALQEEQLFSKMFVSYLLSRTIKVEEDFVDQLFNSSEERLARALLLLADSGKEDCPEVVSGGVSQKMLAEMIGTTRSRVSFFMNKFRKMGLISYNGHHLEVHNSLLSVVLHDQSRAGFLSRKT